MWTYNTNNQIKFKFTLLMWSFCDYSDPYILVNGIIIFTGASVAITERIADRNINQVIFTNCAPFTDRVREKNGQVDNTKNTDVVVLLYILIYWYLLKKDAELCCNISEMSLHETMLIWQILNHLNLNREYQAVVMNHVL